MKQCKVLRILVSLVALVLVCSGCSKLTKQHYDKLKVGMEFKEVRDILGDPVMCGSFTAGTKSCNWSDEPKNIIVKFVGDKVVFMTCRGI